VIGAALVYCGVILLVAALLAGVADWLDRRAGEGDWRDELDGRR
jgi:hypothetical protein